MDLVQDNTRSYTFADYLAWPDDVWCEIIDGVVYEAERSRSLKHQRVLMEVMCQLANYLEDKPCKVLPGRLVVRMDADPNTASVVEPDITVICDWSKTDDIGIAGVPDMIVEILSPFSERMDRVIKYEFYERSGVPEYWIVDPIGKTVDAYELSPQGKYVRIGHEGALVPVGIFKGDLVIDLTEFLAT